MSNYIGRQLGQYEITALLGKGGMATVYRARQASINRDVAVKIIRPDLAETLQFITRFSREAQTIASLSNPHILKVFDYGQQDDVVYLVTELLTGGSLATQIERGPLTLERTMQITEQVASALDYAHGRGIVHRDLKPQNVLLDENGNAFLTDFGLAKLINEANPLTQTGTAMGTPAYMAPEQWRGEALDARADIYALGVMLFEMLSGRLPFTGDTPFSIMHRHVYELPPPVRALNPELPVATEAVLARMLQKNRDERYTRASEAAADLRAAMQGKPISQPIPANQETVTLTSPVPAARPPASIPPEISQPTPLGSVSGVKDQRTAPPRAPLLLGGLVLFALGAIGLLLLLTRNPDAATAGTLTQPPTDAVLASATVVAVAPTASLATQALSVEPIASTLTETAPSTVTVTEALAALPSEAVVNLPTVTATASATSSLAALDTASETPIITASATASITLSTTPSVTPSVTRSSTPTATQTPTFTASVDVTGTAAFGIARASETSVAQLTSTAAAASLAETLTAVLAATSTQAAIATATRAYSDSATNVAAVAATAQAQAFATITAAAEATGAAQNLRATTVRGTEIAATSIVATATGIAGLTATAVAVVPVPPAELTGFILFHTDRNGRWEINRINADGSGFEQVTNGRGVFYTPALSADSTLLAMSTSLAGSPHIWYSELAEFNAKRVTRGGGEYWGAAWSPDSSRIAFHSNRTGNFELYIIAPTGQNEQRLTRSGRGVTNADASWSPDGTQIVFFSDVEKPGGIYVMNADGSEKRRLSPGNLDAADPAWSPDGTQIAFQVKVSNTWDIYVMNADGSNVRQLTNSTDDEQRPAWSPDSRFIAFEAKRDGKTDIYIIGADGTGERRLTSNEGNNGWPTWGAAR